MLSLIEADPPTWVEPSVWVEDVPNYGPILLQELELLASDH
jgi:hypothetical protein